MKLPAILSLALLPFSVCAQDFDIEEFKAKAEAGDVIAQNNLGVCYATGRGVAQNAAEAVKWWRQAAEQGHVLSQMNLGVCYEEGDGVDPDLSQAYIWYAIAAAGEHAQALDSRNRAAARMTAEQITAAQSDAESLWEEIKGRRAEPDSSTEANE